MTSDYLQKMRLFSRDVWLYLIAAAAVGAGLFGVLGVTRNLYLLRLGYGPEFIGLTAAVGSVAWAAIAFPAGAIARRWGIRRTMVLGLATVIVATVLFSCAEFVPDRSRVPWIVVLGALSQIGMTLFMVNAYPALAGATDESERPHAFSLWLAIIPLAGFAGALVAGQLPGLFARWFGLLIDAPGPFRYTLWVGAACFLPGVLAVLATQKVGGADAASASRATGGAAPIAVIAVLALTALLTKAAVGTPQGFFNVYLDADLGLSTASIGTLMAIAQLVSAGAVLSAPMLMARLAQHGTFALACAGMVTGLLLLGSVPQWLAAGLGYTLLSAMAFVADASFNVSSQEAVAPGWRSTVAGANFMAEGISRTAVGAAGGLAIVAYGYRPVFLFVAMLAAGAGAIFWTYFHRQQMKQAG
jgi:MFS family permease